MTRLPIEIDLREGFRSTAKWYIAGALLAVVFALSFLLTVRARGFDAASTPCNLGNLCANALAGMTTFLPSPREPFKFPVSWAITLLLLAYITLGYPYRDLMEFGQKVLVAGRSRRSWWLAKCVWVILSALAFWLVFFGTTALMAVILGGGLDLTVSSTLEKALRWDVPVKFDSREYALFLASIPLITAALCLLQLCLSLFLRPTISYLVTFSGLFLAAFYYQAPFLLGNYLMALRTPGVAGTGFPPLWGIVLGILIAIVSVAIGEKRFSHMDILGEEL